MYALIIGLRRLYSCELNLRMANGEEAETCRVFNSLFIIQE